MLVDTNAYLLGLTLVVSLLHTIFDFLAFKNGGSCPASYMGPRMRIGDRQGSEEGGR